MSDEAEQNNQIALFMEISGKLLLYCVRVCSRVATAQFSKPCDNLNVTQTKFSFLHII